MRDEDLAGGLYSIAKGAAYVVAERDGHRPKQLDYGTGMDFSNDVFTMYGYWSHAECLVCEERGYEVEESILLEAGNTPDAIEKGENLVYPYGFNYQYELAMSRYPEHDCPLVDWHFEHHASGLKVKWYKRIGRSTESNDAIKDLRWYKIVVECLESLKREVDDG